jgi:hypothetical protein
MKTRITLSAALCMVLIAGFAFGQEFPTDKNSRLVSGGLMYSNSGGDLYEVDDDDRVTSLTIQPVVTTFVAPGIALGAKAIYTRSAAGNSTHTAVGIGPHVAVFVTGFRKPAKIEGATLPYIGASWLYNSYSMKYTSYTYEMRGVKDKRTVKDTDNGSTIAFGLGFMHMLTRTFALQTEIGYQIDKIDDNSGNKFNIIVGFSGFVF